MKLQPIDRDALARQLKVYTSTLNHAVRVNPYNYKTFTIRKKNGKERVLHAPAPWLKHLQRRILDTYLNALPYPPHVTAYVPGRSMKDTTKVHTHSACLLVIDLADFFGTTRRSWVTSALRVALGVPDSVAYTIASACCTGGVLPQGAPTSGALANLVAMCRLDPGLLAIAERYGLTYTRYADDIAFSSKTRLSSADISEILRRCFGAIFHAGYRPNFDKVRVQSRKRAQTLLGFTLNDGLSIARKDYRKFRALLHQCARDGLEVVARREGLQGPLELLRQVEGRLAYHRHVDPHRGGRLALQFAQVPIPVSEVDPGVPAPAGAP